MISTLRSSFHRLILHLAMFAGALPAQVVISQVYGGGGNAGATLKNDFIEVFNRVASAVDLTGWSVQYGATGGTTWQVTNLAGAIVANHLYVVLRRVRRRDGKWVKEVTGSCKIIDFKSTQARMPAPQNCTNSVGYVAQAFLPVLFLSR